MGANRHPKQRYYSHVFYKLKQPHEWDMHFVIMKEDPAFQKFIREKYLDCVDGVRQIVILKSSARCIKLKPENEELDQWQVTELRLIKKILIISLPNKPLMFLTVTLISHGNLTYL